MRSSSTLPAEREGATAHPKTGKAASRKLWAGRGAPLPLAGRVGGGGLSRRLRLLIACAFTVYVCLPTFLLPAPLAGEPGGTPLRTLLPRTARGGFLGETERRRTVACGYGRSRSRPRAWWRRRSLLEDRRFWSHPGVDPRAVARAVDQNLRGARRISEPRRSPCRWPACRTRARAAIDARGSRH